MLPLSAPRACSPGFQPRQQLPRQQAGSSQSGSKLPHSKAALRMTASTGFSAGCKAPNVPPYWLMYFLVSNCDETAAKAQELGAKTLLAPTTMEKVGRWAILADPQGAVFALYQSVLR